MLSYCVWRELRKYDVLKQLPYLYLIFKTKISSGINKRSMAPESWIIRIPAICFN